MPLPVPHPRARVLVAGLAAIAVASLLPSAAAAPAGPGSPADRYEWVALGDSYTAGLFVGAPQPALGDPARDGCDRTARSYPDLAEREFAAHPLDKPVHLTDVSCDNAAIGNITSDSQQPSSPVQPPGGAPGNWPLVEPQIRRAELGERTGAVTVGIGGISLPFGECLELSLAHQSCREHYTHPPAGEESLGTKLARVRDAYRRMLGDLHRAAPRAEVITVGYPAVLPERGSVCGDSPAHIGPISPADIDWLRDDALKALNRIISQETARQGDVYVDLYTSSVGHDVCRPEGTKWIEGICGDAADFWPATLPGLPFDCAALGKRATLVHPNAKEHANAARLVEHALRRALSDG
ncbi:SGNH/GDSL hydrolase family protein [Streptomyces sp. NRRL F-5123]|uniref:SGNH/GDSL hydrolase family protein n=1 Tax=Streptomyces sp. NRRL F-5123 TaxID=1463856 RepID=UPI0004E1DDA8|nr:SGNH/GDSL hydrolase family protein [Streptomyces sp. NRRL F-5123]